jgi:hypothetical protein
MNFDTVAEWMQNVPLETEDLSTGVETAQIKFVSMVSRSIHENAATN